MDAIYNFLLSLVQKFPIVGLILMGLGSLVVVMSAYIAATPSPEDDKWWNKVKEIPVLGVILAVLERFSALQRKP